MKYVIENTQQSLSVLLDNSTENFNEPGNHSILISNIARRIVVTAINRTAQMENGTLRIWSSHYKTLSNLSFENLNFYSMEISLINLKIAFLNCTFHSTFMTNEKIKSDIVVLQIKIVYCLWKEIQGFENGSSYLASINQITIGTVHSLQLLIIKSRLINTFIFIKSEYFSVELQQVEYFYFPHISHKIPEVIGVYRQSTWFVVRNSVTLENLQVIYNSTTAHKYSVPFLSVYLQHLSIHIFKSSFINSNQVLKVANEDLPTKDDGLMLSVWLESCRFEAIVSKQDGGAIMIKLYKQVMPIVAADIRIIKCSFKRVQSTQNGGSVYISTHKYNSINNANVTVLIQNSTFTDCFSHDKGGSLYLSAHIEAIIEHVIFHIRDSILLFGQGLILFSEAFLNIKNVYAINENNRLRTTLFQLDNIRKGHQIKVRCPNWFYVSMLSFSDSAVTISCDNCQGAMYAAYLDYFTISYNSNENENSLIKYMNTNISSIKCLPCPYGAVCSNGELKPLPGYWGVQVTDHVEFTQCPESYCCTQQCSFLNSCAGYRTGVLCSSCKQSFSLSILSGDCVRNSICHDTWVWSAAVMAALFYMLWYTLKADMVDFILKYLRKIIILIFHHDIPFNNGSDDLGYFGILVYFTQIVALIQISDGTGSNDSLQNVVSYLNFMINIDPTSISIAACPIKDLSLGRKFFLRFAFYIGIFVSWGVVFLFVELINRLFVKHKEVVVRIKLKFLAGLIEIIKYTYEGLATISFMSLVCVKIAGDNVWKFDAETKCLSLHQWFFLLFSAFYIFPFLLALSTAKKYLKEERISALIFVIACFFPLSFILYIITRKVAKLSCLSRKKCTPQSLVSQFNKKVKTKKTSNKEHRIEVVVNGPSSKHELSTTSTLILNCLEGPYQTEGQAVYWESILGARRLILTLVIFINNIVWKFMLIQILCICIILHHTMIKPFKNNKSNRIESVSLALIMLIANFNALKGYFIDSGIIVTGPSIHPYNFFSFIERLSLFFLLFTILFVEIYDKKVIKIRKK